MGLSMGGYLECNLHRDSLSVTIAADSFVIIGTSCEYFTVLAPAVGMVAVCWMDEKQEF